MSYIVSITTKKDTGFLNEAKTILESHKFSIINENTYIGNKSTHSIVNQLKVLDIYKKDKVNCSISLYHGNVSKV